MKMTIQTLLMAVLMTMSMTATADSAQQFFFACYTSDHAVISVQQDAAGSVSLSRTENEKIPSLDITTMIQRQILVANPGDAPVVALNGGDTKQITMNFHGQPADSQIVLSISGSRMSISGTGAAMARVKETIYGSKSGRGLSGCSIDIQ